MHAWRISRSYGPSLGGIKEELSISHIVYPVIRPNFEMGTPYNTIQDDKVPLTFMDPSIVV